MKYQVFGILWTVFNLALMLVMGIVGIYLLWLVIKALRVYINSHEVREEKKATRKSLAEALRENRVRCKMTQEFVSETIGVSRCNLVRRTEKGRLRRRGWGLRWEKAQKGGKGTNLRGFFED